MTATRVRNAGKICSVDGCTSPSRKRGWCASHYAQQRRTGEPPRPFKWKWGQEGPRPFVNKNRKKQAQLCIVCGSTERRINTHRFCSTGCKALFYRYDGRPPSAVPCSQCGLMVDLTARHPSGRRRRSTLGLCEACAPWTWRSAGLTVHDLASRDGTDCSICGQPVDLSLRRTDSFMSPSIDHVVPRSRGGTDDPSNLRLAHLLCNCRKADRLSPLERPQ
jgi:hypothetical protein